MQQSRVNNKYLIIRFNTLLLSHKTSRLAKNRTQVRTASKQHGRIRLNTDLISLFFSREAWVNIFISLYLRIKQIYLYIFVYARARSIPHTRSERCGLRSSNTERIYRRWQGLLFISGYLSASKLLCIHSSAL